MLQPIIAYFCIIQEQPVEICQIIEMLQKDGRASTDEIRAAILSQLPIGSTESQIYNFLESKEIASGYGVGVTYYSVYETTSERGVSVTIRSSPRPWIFLPDSYGIALILDSAGRLSGVRVGYGVDAL